MGEIPGQARNEEGRAGMRKKGAWNEDKRARNDVKEIPSPRRGSE